MTRFLLTGFILTLLLSGCISQPSDHQSGEHADRRIDDLLFLADEAYRHDRLTTPAEDNAYLYFQQIIELDPGNPDARHGINDIIEKYLAWARDAADQERFSRARQYVRRAKSIDASHPNIPAVESLINERQSRIAITYELDASHVRDRHAKALPFEKIADRIARMNAFVTIRADDDATGRWLYQQLNNRLSFRLEARFVSAHKPAVELEQRSR